MKRLQTININTPEHFNRIWSLEDTHYFDRIRMEAFTTSVKDGDEVLDVGAGLYSWGEYLLFKNRNVKVHAIDISSYAQERVKAAYPKIDYVLGNALDLPWTNNSFDVVGAGEVIEHMEDPSLLVKEMVRVCKKGGQVIIGTVDPDCQDSKLNGCIYPEHLWQFTPKDLGILVAPYGLYRYKRVGNYDFVYCTKGDSSWAQPS